MKLNANVKNLRGKYYGTIIEVIDTSREISNDLEITVWYMGDYRNPSTRQLLDWKMTLDEAKEEDMLADGHWESQDGYRIAQAIADALNKIQDDEHE